MMKKGGFMKDALILFAITLVAGVCLGIVNEITKGPIENANIKARLEAYQEVFETASDFKMASDLTDQVTASAESMSELGLGNVRIDEVVRAVDESGGEMGYVVTSTSKEGYGGDVTIAVGISSQGTIQGISYLTLAETVGIGMEAQNWEFKKQYIDKNVESFKIVKNTAVSDDEIEALSGATITTNAVTNAVNAALYFIDNTVGR